MGEQFVILVGNLTNGYHATGVFDSYDAALSYASTHIHSGQYWVFKLYPPEPDDA